MSNALLIALVGYLHVADIPLARWVYVLMLASGLYQAAIIALGWAVARHARRAAEERDEAAGHGRRRP